MNAKPPAICDSKGRPLNLFVPAGQVNDCIGARALLSSIPNTDWLLGDRGYDADWLRVALENKGIRACIPGRKQRKTPVKYDKRGYKRRNRPFRDIRFANARPGTDRDHVRQGEGLVTGRNPL
jgi:IS5 family transposase